MGAENGELNFKEKIVRSGSNRDSLWGLFLFAIIWVG